MSNDLINVDRSTIVDVHHCQTDCLSVVMVLLEHVFRQFNVLNDLSPSAEVTDMYKECTKRGAHGYPNAPLATPLKRTSPTSKQIIIKLISVSIIFAYQTSRWHHCFQPIKSVHEQS